MEAKTETKADTAAGTVKSEMDTVVGTVTKYDPGKKIEVITAEKKSRSFSLDAKDAVGDHRPRRRSGLARARDRADGHGQGEAPDGQARRLRESARMRNSRGTCRPPSCRVAGG